MKIIEAGEGISIHRDDEQVDHYVLVRADIEVDGRVLALLAPVLEAEGLCLMDPEECEPEHVEDGLKLYLAEIDGGLALDALYAEAAVA